jgi:hypothetical protein
MRSATFALAVLVFVVFTPAAGTVARDSRLPSKLGDAEFWRLVTTLSEPGGSFPSNNFVSNETEYQTVIPRLQATFGTGGVYLGVGPDQNFSYITALQPKITFILDIRRQNLLQHLLYKALIERSPTRVEFLSRLFSRPRPPGLGDDATAADLLEAFAAVPPSYELFAATVNDVRTLLVDKHGFTLSDADLRTIEFVHRAFYDGGPDLTYAGPRLTIAGDRVRSLTMYPTYGELATETDDKGVAQGYLSSARRYRTLRDLQMKNLIVPVVGDFAGPTALRAIGTYLKDHRATVSAIYTSNVEQYLFQNGVWGSYYDNVAMLPIDARTSFIRSFFANQGVRFIFDVDRSLPALQPGVVQSVSLLCPVSELLDAYRSGRIRGYGDVIALSK